MASPGEKQVVLATSGARVATDQNAQVWPPKAALIMEMLERCPGCSVAREAESKKAEFVSSPRRPRPCAHCGYDGPFPPAEPERSAPRESLPSFAGARAKLATATQDLFRLSGNHSIPVDASVSEPPAPEPPAPPPPEPPPVSTSRKPEASIMFSLEELMKANQQPSKPDTASEDASSQLWSMQAAEPLFGTAHDQALLTTPLKMEPAQSMDSMTLPSEAPNARRWWPIVVAASAGLALAAAGIWMFGAGAAARHPTPASEQAALEAQPPAEPPPVLPAPPPAPAEPVAVAAPSDPANDAVPEPGAEPAEADTDTEADPTAEAAPEDDEDEAEEEKVRKERKVRPRRRAKARARATRRAAASPFKPSTVFDKGAAISALNSAATHAASCGAGGAPGKGKIQVTFTPSGKATNVQLVGGQFSGTTAGKCALRHFRLAKIPPFKGSAVTVAKSFTIY